jgi:parallel beta-helix repeat protein
MSVLSIYVKLWKQNSPILFILVMFIMGLSTFSTPLALQDKIADQSVTVANKEPTRKMIVAYTPHPPIVIYHDDNFTQQGWPGDGSAENPFTIEGLEIDLGGAIGYCINITNTRVNFTIKNCYFTGANVPSFWVDSAGVYLKNVTNGDIVNNICTNNWYAISLRNSTGSIVANNTCSYNLDRGICLEQGSDYTIIKNNTCKYNTNYSIFLSSSHHNDVFNNTCSDNSQDGIYAYNSQYNLFDNNTCYSNTQHGIYLHWLNYYNDIINNTCFDNDFNGISLYISRYNFLANNTCKSNYDGIRLVYSDHNDIIKNNCSDNIYEGIILTCGSNYNLVANNTCSDNNFGIGVIGSFVLGIGIKGSNHNTLVNNTCEKNPNYGIHLEGYSSQNVVLNNTCANNTCSDGGYGFYTLHANSTILANNTCERNEYGIYISIFSFHSNITNNNCSENDYGIYVYSLFNTINNNNCSDNDFIGIIITGSNNTVFNNTCSDHESSGIYVQGSDHNLLTNNTCERNYYGIIIDYNSNYNNVTENTCSDNNGNGIRVDESNHNLLTNNTCEINGHGIALSSSDDNTLVNNTCSDNIGYGIYVDYYSYDNFLTNNTCERNSHGIGLDFYSQYNTLMNNTCSWNTFCGLVLNSSTRHNVVTNCTCNYNSEFGIILTGADHNEITNSTCNYNGKFGIILVEDTYYVGSLYNNITRNTFYGNIEGIHVNNSDSNIIENNTIYHNSGSGIGLISSALSNTVQWNILVNNSNNVWNDQSSNVIDYNYYSDYDGYDNDGNGIGDVPYLHDGSASSEDTHPLMFPGGYLYIRWTEAIIDHITEYPESWQYDLDVIAMTSVHSWWINDTVHFSIDLNGLITNTTTLVADIYKVMVYVNDTEGHILRGAFTLIVYAAGGPEWIQEPTDQTIEFSMLFQYDLDAVAPSGLDIWWINDTVKFHIDQTGLITNVTTLTVGTYHLEVKVNDTLGHVLTKTFTLVVEPTAPPEWIQEPTDQTSEFGDTFQYDLDAVDTSGLDIWWINDTVRFHIDQTGMITNATVLMVGTYYLQVMVNDTLGYIQTAQFAVIVQDTTSPVWIENPVDQALEFGDSLVYDLDAWDLSGIASWWINNTVHFSVDENGVITNATILDFMTYSLEVKAYDIYDNFCTATIKIILVDTTQPTINQPNDIEYNVGDTGYSIVWEPRDLLPSSYQVLRNGIEVKLGAWNSTTEVIEVPVDGLSAGSYNYTIIVTDEGANFATDSVFVTVNPVATTTTTSTTTTTTTTTSTPMDLTLISTVVTLGALAIIVVFAVKIIRSRK